MFGVVLTPHPVYTQAGPRRVPGFELTQEWIQIARSHRVGEDDAAVAKAMGKGVTDLDGRRVSGDLTRVLQDLSTLKILVRKIAAGGSEVDLFGRVMKMESLVQLLGLSETIDGFPDKKTLSNPDSSQWRGITEAMIAVAVLHTDVAMTPPERWARTPPGHAVDIQDGRLATGIDVRLHYAIARAAVDVALPSTEGAAFGRLWYHATSAFLQNTRNYLALFPHLEEARMVLPGEARMFLFSGAALENVAAPRVQAAFQGNAGSVTVVGPPELLFKAEPFLRRALELDPASAETRVRLGRVLYLRGRDADALAMLTQAETGTDDPLTKYFAALFAGRAAERLGDDEKARLAYERARTLFPNVQSPRIALAALNLRQADQPAAQENLRTLLAKPDAPAAADPWWTYDVWLAQNVDLLIAEVRTIRAFARR